jgi:hypothetical protein
MGLGVPVKFQGGAADGHVAVWPGAEPPEFLDYRAGEEDETSYRHCARPSTVTPYHVYVPFEREEEKAS